MNVWRKLFGKKPKHPEVEGIEQKTTSRQEKQPAIPEVKSTPVHPGNISQVCLPGHVGSIQGVDGALDGSFFATGSEDGTVRLWDPKTAKELSVISVGSVVGALALSANGKRFIIGCDSGLVEVWDIESKEPLRHLEGHKSYCSSIALSRNGRWALSAAWDESGALLWNLYGGRLERELLPSRGSWLASSVAFSPSSRLLAIASAGAIVIYEPASGIMVKQLIGHAGTWCNTLQFIDDDTIASVGSTGRVYVQRISDGTFLHRFDVGTAASGAFSSEGKRVVVGDTGGRISEWDIETGSPVMAWTKVHSQHVRALAYLLTGSYIYISGDTAGEVRLWRAGAQVSVPEVAREETARDRIAELKEALRVRPDWAQGYEQLALLYYEEGDALNMFRHFHAASQLDPNLNTPHKYLRTIYIGLGRPKDVQREIFEDRRTNRPSPTRLVSEVRDRLMRMTLAHRREMAALAEELRTKVTVVEKSIPVVEGKPAVWRAHQDRVRSVTFLPGGQGLVSGSSDRTMIWWDLETRSPKKRWAFQGGISQIAASPDGSAWGASFYDGTAAVWLLPGGRRKDLPEQMTAHYCVGFSPNGKWYAMGYHYGTVFLFPTSSYSQQSLKTEGNHGAPVGLGFSPSSSYIAASFSKNVVIVWDLQSGGVLRKTKLDRAGGIAILESPLRLVIGTVWLGDEAKREYPDSVQVRDFETGQVLHRLEEARGGMAVTPDGKLLACCSLQGGVQLWNTADWRMLASFQVPGKSLCTAISFERDRIACGTKEGSIAIFDIPHY